MVPSHWVKLLKQKLITPGVRCCHMSFFFESGGQILNRPWCAGGVWGSIEPGEVPVCGDHHQLNSFRADATNVLFYLRRAPPTYFFSRGCHQRFILFAASATDLLLFARIPPTVYFIYGEHHQLNSFCFLFEAITTNLILFARMPPTFYFICGERHQLTSFRVDATHGLFFLRRAPPT